MQIPTPYLLFLGDAADQLAAKTAIGVFHWRPEICVGQLRLPGCVPRLPLTEMDVARGVAAGARTLLVGVANRGGQIPDSWVPTFLDALEQGLDIANGLHTRLDSIAPVARAARRLGRRLYEARHPVGPFPIATAQRRSGQRLLTVGSDCSVGKMYTALALERELTRRGVAADFRATGQTGILIAGNGISVDAVVCDFLAGAVETLTPANAPDHWDLVEGQGSLFHPSFAGVSLGLIHGAQPSHLVLCHEPTRTHMRGLPDQPLPALADVIAQNLVAARLVSPQVSFAGAAINTAALAEPQARALLAQLETELGMPCVDPLRDGVGRIVDALPL
jgi:uncharacterized NAD-dependent epimerase/dehydratase family protein